MDAHKAKIDNERLKLAANHLNIVSAFTLGTGVIAPFIQETPYGSVIWFFLAFAIHLVASLMLRRLKPED